LQDEHGLSPSHLRLRRLHSVHAAYARIRFEGVIWRSAREVLLGMADIAGDEMTRKETAGTVEEKSTFKASATPLE
jgi:hypothetical protein